MWQKGIEIVKDIYVLTRKFPKEEICGLTAQMRRSA
ncbi:MAG: four helix bundle protein, partial [bacterium]|nr:four helix bundle protein [bacterium]